MVFQEEQPIQQRIKPGRGKGTTSVVPAKGPGNFQSNTLWEGQEPTLEKRKERKKREKEKRKLSWKLDHSFPERNNQKEKNDPYLPLFTSKVVT